MIWYAIAAGVFVLSVVVGLAVAAWMVGDYDLGIFEQDEL